MPMMKAVKTFAVSETGKLVHPGDIFSVKDRLARQYEERGMAYPVRQETRSPQKSLEKPAQPGSPTGEDKPQSLSPPAQAQPARGSRAQKADADPSP